MITISEPAARKIKTLIGGAAGKAFRVKVVGGGCSGLQYKLDLEAAPAADDSVVEAGAAKVVVDPASALYLLNSQVDYVESLKFSGFKITNPNAVAECSCGQSFAV